MAGPQFYNPFAAPIFPDGAAFGTGSPAETSQQPAGLGTLASGAYNYLGNLAQRAFGSAQMMRDTGVYDPAPIMEAAMLPMGTGAIAGVPVKGAEAVLGAGPIRAYHGSPHDFDAFDLSKIGTGEGAQAYGHGLYFAEHEPVAKEYRDQLANGVYSTKDGIFDPSGLGHLNVRVAARNGIDDGLARAQELLKSQPQNAEMLQRDILALQDAKARGASPNPGRMYEVNINADPEHFLDWDKPLNQQHPTVQKSFQPIIDQKLKDLERSRLSGQEKNDIRDSLVNKTLTGRDLYAESAPTREKAAATLADQGIPGIKYLDQGSRGAGQGSSNYVVFNDKLIDIMRKYAIPGLMGGAPILAKPGEQKT